MYGHRSVLVRDRPGVIYPMFRDGCTHAASTVKECPHDNEAWLPPTAEQLYGVQQLVEVSKPEAGNTRYEVNIKNVPP